MLDFMSAISFRERMSMCVFNRCQQVPEPVTNWNLKLSTQMQYIYLESVSRLGLDPKLLAKILNMSSGRCWSSEVYNPVPGVLEGVPSSNNYKGGFGTALMTKVNILCVTCEAVLWDSRGQNRTNVVPACCDCLNLEQGKSDIHLS